MVKTRNRPQRPFGARAEERDRNTDHLFTDNGLAIDHWILACPTDPARQSLLVEFVETYVALADHEQAEFQTFVRNDPEYTQVQQMITTYEQRGGRRRDRGREEGKQETGSSDSGVGEEVWDAGRCPEAAGS